MGSPDQSQGAGSEESQQTAAALALGALPADGILRVPSPAAWPLSGTPQSAERRSMASWQPGLGAAGGPLCGDMSAGGAGGAQGSMPPDTLQALLEEMEGLPPLEGSLAGSAGLDW